MLTDPDRVARELVELNAHRAPRLGDARLVSIDGRSGSGKTVLAMRVGEILCGLGVEVRPLAIESAYAGWDGLEGTPEHLAGSLLAPLAEGRPGRLRTYDWLEGRLIDDRQLDPPSSGSVLLVEGVGAGTAPVAAYASVVVWCEATAAVRRERAMRRDRAFGRGRGADERWERWASQEDALFSDDPVAARADLTWHSGVAPT